MGSLLVVVGFGGFCGVADGFGWVSCGGMRLLWGGGVWFVVFGVFFVCCFGLLFFLLCCLVFLFRIFFLWWGFVFSRCLRIIAAIGACSGMVIFCLYLALLGCL